MIENRRSRSVCPHTSNGLRRPPGEFTWFTDYLQAECGRGRLKIAARGVASGDSFSTHPGGGINAEEILRQWRTPIAALITRLRPVSRAHQSIWRTCLKATKSPRPTNATAHEDTTDPQQIWRNDDRRFIRAARHLIQLRASGCFGTIVAFPDQIADADAPLNAIRGCDRRATAPTAESPRPKAEPRYAHPPVGLNSARQSRV
jgi:hypothetical protein